MKITKNASGKTIVKLSQKEWENFGKKAGWLNEDNNLTVQAGELAKQAEEDEMLREAQPAPVKEPRKAPTKRPGEKKKPGNPFNPGKHEPAPAKAKGKSKKQKELENLPDSSAENLPTIASELKRMNKNVQSK